MTTNPTNDDTLDQIENESKIALDILRRRIDEMETAKRTQPERLAKARDDAEQARGWALIEEPLDGQIATLASVDGTASLSMPNIMARELFGARLCFDLLDADDDEIDAIIARLFAAANGDPGVAMVVMSAALTTIASLVVPQLLDQIERQGSDYDERVRLCEARAKAWNGRVSAIRECNDQADRQGVKPVDGFDIGAAALDEQENPDV